MMIHEFETLTGFHPCWALWEEINRAYNESRLDKHEWCKAYAEDKDGMAEKIARIADRAIDHRLIEQSDALKAAKAGAEELRRKLAGVQEQLDRELEWKPAERTGTMLPQETYAELRDSEAAGILTELEAMQKLHWLFGFDMAKIAIVPEVQTFDINKHHKLRVSGTYKREPVWGASDWNYIRFDCAGLQWECIDGELYPYCD